MDSLIKWYKAQIFLHEHFRLIVWKWTLLPALRCKGLGKTANATEEDFGREDWVFLIAKWPREGVGKG